MKQDKKTKQSISPEVILPKDIRSQHNNKKTDNSIVKFRSGERRLSALSAISDLITQSLENREVLTLAAEKIQELLEADAIMAFRIEDGTDNLTLQIYRGVSDAFVAGVKRIKIGEGFNGKVAQTGEPLLVDDTVSYESPRHQVINAEGIRSQLIVPLKSKGEVIGTLCVARRTPIQFSPDEVSLLNNMGSLIGATLENARLYAEMKETLKQLASSEERYRDLFENATDAIWVHDFEGNTIAANAACERVTGFDADELKEMQIDHLVDLFGKSCIDHIEEALLSDTPMDHNCEIKLDRKDGSKAVLEVTTSLVSHDGIAVAFQHSARDVTNERRMQESLRYYLQQVTRAQEEERKRVARELHDETLQNLIVISRQLEKITSSEALWEESLEDVRGLRKQIETAVQEIRRFSHDLRPSVLDDLGLLPALELLADDLEKLGIPTTFKVVGESRRLTPEAEVMLFRIAQEATRNIYRHSKASMAELTIEFVDSKLRMSIRDNGRGFNVPQQPRDQAMQGKMGMAGMHERARLLGGNLTIDSSPKKGTTILTEVRV